MSNQAAGNYVKPGGRKLYTEIAKFIGYIQDYLKQFINAESILARGAIRTDKRPDIRKLLSQTDLIKVKGILSNLVKGNDNR